MTPKRAGTLFFVIILSYMGMIFILSGLNAFIPELLDILPSTLMSEGSVLLPTLIFALCTPALFRDMFPFRRIKLPTVFLAAVMTFTLFPVVIFVNSLSMLFVDNTAELLSGDVTKEPIWSMILLIGIVGPFIEETVFRGYLFQSFRVTGRIMGSVVLSAVLFGLMHMNINQACYAAVLGIFLALAAEASGSVFASMIIHMLFNSVEILLMYLAADLQSAVGAAGGSGMGETADDILASALGGYSGSLLVPIIVFGVLSVIGIILSVLLLHAMAAIEGRPFGRRRTQPVYEELQQNPGAEKPEAVQKPKRAVLASVPLVFGMAISIAYMIAMEIFT